MHAQTLPVFDIRNFVDNLTPRRQKHTYDCPVCEGKLSINRKTGAYNCYSDDSDKHRRAIKEALSPQDTIRLVGKPIRPILRSSSSEQPTSPTSTSTALDTSLERLESHHDVAPHHVAHLLDEEFSLEQIEIFKILGVRSVDDSEAREMGFVTRDKDGSLISGSGLLLPFTDTFAQLRLDLPITRKNGAIAKYLTPCKRQAEARIPDGCTVYTEGWKDSQAGTLHGGVITGALAGVSHYRKALKGSGGVIIFDSDGWTNPNVFQSLFNAGRWIEGKVNLLPEISGQGQPKAGLCEFFKSGYTAKDYKALIDDALTPEAFLLALPDHWTNLPTNRVTKAVHVLMKLAAKHLDPIQRSILIRKVARVTGVDRRQVGGVVAREIRKENGAPPCKQKQRIQQVESVWGDRFSQSAGSVPKTRNSTHLEPH